MLRRLRELLGAAALWSAMSSVALGAFSSVPAAPSMQVASATLAAPTSVAASAGCRLLHLGPQVVLTWTATTSAFADGYAVLRSTTSGSGYSQIATVIGQSTTTYTDTTPALSTTYYYVVKASKGTGWTSIASNEASATTPLVCL
jgi:fibronectin type 3 domain-containing protein